MNPIEFLKTNGLNPDNFRTPVPPRTTLANHYALYRHTPDESRQSTRTPAKRISRLRDTTNLSLVDTLLENRGWTKVRSSGIAPILPYLMADQMMLVDDEYLKHADFRQKEREHYTRMMEHYWAFSRSMYRDLTKEQGSLVTDLMDEFGEYIHNELEIFRLSIIGCIMEYEDSYRTTCGALCLAKLLICQANKAWKAMYRKRNGEPTIEHNLQGMEKHITELLNHYFKREARLYEEEANLSSYTVVRRNEENVVKKILKFLKEYEHH